ncbi:Transcription initiation factor TFIID subunit 12 [Orbilia oligospora]|uniref:TBP-associated factor 12 n=1 Tax=Orbilia oligospora TaxID=2813651 RepID=A0A7C8R3V7_ORBOL|nr:Transcription initiation factor TFIID subunit 12 [Orbilia oligospora]
MIKQKRPREDEEHQQHQISSPPYLSNHSSVPRSPKLSKPASIADVSSGSHGHIPLPIAPTLNNNTIVAMLPSGQPNQPTPGVPQQPSSTMEETRAKYIQIQQGLKAEIQQFGQNHPRGITAMKKLEQFNQHMANLRNQQASQRAAATAANQHPQAQASAMVPLVPQVAAQPRPAPSVAGQNISNRPGSNVGPTTQLANAPSAGGNGASQPMKLLVPGHIDPENADNWRREAEARLRTAYASMVSFRTTIQSLQAAISSPEKPLSSEELADKRAQLEQIQKQNKKCEDFINAFRMQQSTLVRNAAATNASSTEPAAGNNPAAEIPTTITTAADIPASATGPAVPPLAKAAVPVKAPTLQQGSSNIGSVGNALAAASTQNAVHSNPQAGSQKSPTSATPLRTPATQTVFPPGANISQMPVQTPPHATPRSSSVSGPTAPHPHTLQQAISQPGPDLSSKPSIPVTANTPAMQREGASAHRLPIPKSLTMPAPTAVPVPPARPTLPGGTHAPSGSQVVGAPAIAKAPQFELDEASGGLLSKRKLQELVRQIDPDESLDPEVEESVLELTDDFVDTLLTYACRMAKHRGSDALDIRDVQMILERNWNIRIPGYSMDDIRTVRKFNPTASYQQKLQALQAGKALNQSEISKDA